MADTLTNAQIQEYTDIVRHLAQQGDSRLRPHVYETPSGGEAYHFERLGESASEPKVGRKVPTPDAEPPWSNRTATPKVEHWAAFIEHHEQAQMIVDPQSAYAQNGSMAMRRSIDDELIASATRDATNKAGDTITFPVGQQVGAGLTQGLTLDLITEVNEKFQTNDVDPDEPKCFVVSPIEVREMLNTDKLTNADYQAVKALSANGMVQNFLGFTWILSNRLLKATGVRSCLAFTRRGIGLTVNYDIMVRVAERADLSHVIQVYMEWVMGAVRVEDEHVVEVLTDETYQAPA